VQDVLPDLLVEEELQEMHEVEAALSEYVPAGQASQSSRLPIVRFSEYVPAGQGIGSTVPLGQ